MEPILGAIGFAVLFVLFVLLPSRLQRNRSESSEGTETSAGD